MILRKSWDTLSGDTNAEKMTASCVLLVSYLRTLPSVAVAVARDVRDEVRVAVFVDTADIVTCAVDVSIGARE